MSSLNCDRPLHSGSKAPELVMDASCRDNRWTASLCTYQAVVLSCPYLARRLAVLERRSAWLVVNTQVKVCFRETHVLAGHPKYMDTRPHCAALLNTAHTVGCAVELASVLTAATILADAAVTPTVL